MLRPESIATTLLLTALVAFGPLSAMPALTRVMAADVGRVQLTLSVFLLGFAVAQLVYGPLSDRFGRRPVLIAGIAVYAAASVACAAAPTIEVLIAARFFQAVGACAGGVLARAVVRDVHGRARAAKVLSYMATAMATGLLLAPMLGGYLVVWFGWQAVFLVLAALGVLLVALVAVLLPETNTRPDRDATRPGQVARNYLSLFSSPAFFGFTVANGFVFSGLFAFVSGAPFVLIDHLGLAPQDFGLTFGVVVAGYICGTFISGRLTMALGLERLMGTGCALALVAGLGLAALAVAGVDRPAAVVVPMFFYLVGMGMVMPNAMAGAIGPFPEMAGAASALMGFLQMTMAGAAGVLVGHLDDGTQVPMAMVVAAMAVCGVVAFVALVGRRRG